MCTKNVYNVKRVYTTGEIVARGASEISIDIFLLMKNKRKEKEGKEGRRETLEK